MKKSPSGCLQDDGGPGAPQTPHSPGALLVMGAKIQALPGGAGGPEPKVRWSPANMYIFQGSSLIVPSPEIWTVTPEQAAAAFPPAPGREYGEVPLTSGNVRVPCLMLENSESLPPGWQALPLRQAVSLLDSAAEPLFRTYHIMQWRRESVFCGTCGSRNIDAPDELARLCPACGRLEFPRICPAIIVIIINDRDEALLAHNRKFSPGMYSLIAGFTEAGESLEAAVVRETREEVGLELQDIRYQASQPWPFPNSLMLGFSARHAGGVITPDGLEIEDARWFRRDRLPELPGPGSVSRRLINSWLAGTLVLDSRAD